MVAEILHWWWGSVLEQGRQKQRYYEELCKTWSLNKTIYNFEKLFLVTNIFSYNQRLVWFAHFYVGEGVKSGVKWVIYANCMVKKYQIANMM